MRTPLVLAVAALLGLSSAFLVACGDRNNLLPRSDADALLSDISSARSNFAAQECRAAEANLVAAQDKATELPAEVDSDLRENLRANLEAVREEVRTQCGAARTTTATTATTETQTTATETTPTEPTPTETPTETTPPETQTTPPQTDGDSGGTPAQTGRNRGRGKGKGD